MRIRSWQEVYETEDRKVAEENALKTGTEKVEWLQDGSMKVITKEMEAIKIDERNNLPTWFNSLVLLHPAGNGILDPEERKKAPWNTQYGDFTEISDEEIIIVKDIMTTEGFKFKWHHGDVLVVDNRLTLHGRNSFSGPRRILTSIIA